MSQKGKSITLGIDYEIEVRDKEGKLLSKCSKKDGSDPCVTNAIRMLKAIFTTTRDVVDSLVLTNTLGATEEFYGAGYPAMGANGVATDDTIGIVVGISDLAFFRSQYRLDTKITHGSGGGQLLYGVTTVEDAVEEDNIGRFRIIRAFTNNSGGTITVKEIAIYSDNAESGFQYLLCRDVLPEYQTLPDGATLTVRYRFFVSYI